VLIVSECGSKLDRLGNDWMDGWMKNERNDRSKE
jgi:hypothetical protein